MMVQLENTNLAITTMNRIRFLVDMTNTAIPKMYLIEVYQTRPSTLVVEGSSILATPGFFKATNK